MSEKSVQHLEEVDHGYVRYANVWEDPNLLLEGLNPVENKKVLSIASAGDNAFALLSANPELLVAIDLNYPQLYLTELKIAAIKNLSQDEYIQFAGFRKAENRLECFEELSTHLSPGCLKFWMTKQKEIDLGICTQGKFENYLRTFAKKVLPWIHSKKKINQLFAPKSAKEQQEFFDKKWNSWRWKLLFSIFFSKRVMGMLGRDPAFLAQVEVNVSKTIMSSAASHLSSVFAQENPMLHFCLKGDFGHYLPFYAQKVNYEKIKGNLDRIKLEYGYAQDAVKKYGKFDRFNLSNIFEYMSPEVFQTTSRQLLSGASADAKFGYWNLMVEKVISSETQEVNRIADKNNWSQRDQGFFYMQFIAEKYRADETSI